MFCNCIYINQIYFEVGEAKRLMAIEANILIITLLAIVLGCVGLGFSSG